MDRLNPPDALQLQGNVADHWKRFKQAFRIYQVASGLDTKSSKVQSMTLLHILGSEAVDVYNTFQWRAGECDEHCDADTELHVVDCILRKFDQYCTPKKNVTIERHKFFSRDQGDGETFDVFVTDLKMKAATCEFESLKESLIKDRIVGGVRSDRLRERMLRETDLTLSKAEEICKAAEASEIHLKLMKDSDQIVSTVRKQKRLVKAEPAQSVENCFYCGNSHQIRKCPAYGQTCKKCNKRNHFARE